MEQLDIFNDGRDVMLANDLAGALASDDLARARGAAAVLAAEFPDDPRLAPAVLLIDALAARTETAFADAAAAFFIAARAWGEALAALAGIESWRHQPQPLAWAAEATWHHAGPDAGWPLLAELAWLGPARTPALIQALGDAKLTKLAARFEGDLDGEDWSWLPAWLLVEQPLLAGPLDAALPSRDRAPERAFRAVQALLRLERQGRHGDIAEHRRRLRDLHPALLALYMKTRA